MGEALIIAAFVIMLQGGALIVTAIANLRSHKRTRRLMASYDEALDAKDTRIAAYERLIASQDALIDEQRQIIRLHEKCSTLRGAVEAFSPSRRRPMPANAPPRAPGELAEIEHIAGKIADHIARTQQLDLAEPGARSMLALSGREWAVVLAALRASNLAGSI